MLTLKREYASEGDVPTEVAALYKEQDGKFVLQATIEGMKTQADVEKVQKALNSERDAHKALKDKFELLPADLDLEKLQEDLDELAELRAGKDGKPDDEKIEEIVTRRLARQLGPVERERDKLKQQVTDLTTERDGLLGEKRTGTLHSQLREAATAAKVVDTAVEDILLHGERLFEIDEHGSVVPKDGSKLDAGLTPAEWLDSLRESKPHFFPMSSGSGARGAGGGDGKSNPWSKDGWNLTAQGQYVQKHGEERAKQAAASVGSALGATKPPA